MLTVFSPLTHPRLSPAPPGGREEPTALFGRVFEQRKYTCVGALAFSVEAGQEADRFNRWSEADTNHCYRLRPSNADQLEGVHVRTNYVLIDFENVQPESLSALCVENFKVMVFVGANQNKITFDTAAALQRLGDKAEYVKITGNGPNALDFHIAYYIGRISAEDPGAYFHIVSKDTGFDPLIRHLKAQKVLAARSKDVTDIPLLKAMDSKTVAERIDVVVMNLQQRGASRPRTLKTLTSTINSLFQKQLSEEELVAVMRGMESKGLVVIDGSKVTYSLPQIEG